MCRLPGATFSHLCTKHINPRDGSRSHPSVSPPLIHCAAIPAEVASVSAQWTGSTASCTAGDVDADWRAATISRINLYREMCGLDNVTNNPSMSTFTQAGSLIISANSALSHTPPPTQACWTQTGFDSSSTSNIAFGTQGPRSVDAYIDDSGGNNAAVGHRFWKLFPNMEFVGTGDTGTGSSSTDAIGNNILVLGGASAHGVASIGSGRTTPTFVAWPPAGFCPFTLLPTSARWSFFKGGVDFASATVTINAVPATVTYTASGTLVFTGAVPNDWQGVETDYDVVVTAEGTVYTYTTTVFDAITPETPTWTALEVRVLTYISLT